MPSLPPANILRLVLSESLLTLIYDSRRICIVRREIGYDNSVYGRGAALEVRTYARIGEPTRAYFTAPASRAACDKNAFDASSRPGEKRQRDERKMRRYEIRAAPRKSLTL